ncbi:MAG TPA: (2Fe-2S)-binding protein, partial [Saprospiraceae bacterium]|nr:(2Fe-2S)-binding protein [Saprospiraceae bacterium]
NTCTIGAGITVTDLLESKDFSGLFPDLAKHLKLVSSAMIRNVSTLAGNFVNASPIGDMTAFFLALNAQITLAKDHQKRIIFLKHFYKGYKDLDKGEGEIITEIIFNIPFGKFNFEKVSKRTHLDIASVNSAASIKIKNGIIQEAHISAGGIGPIPTYLSDTCNFLNNKELSPTTIIEANNILQKEISPISDVRGSVEYKRLLLRQLFFAHFIELYPETISLSNLILQS